MIFFFLEHAGELQYIKKNKGEKSPKELQKKGPVTTLVNYYKKKKQARPNKQDPYHLGDSSCWGEEMRDSSSSSNRPLSRLFFD